MYTFPDHGGARRGLGDSPRRVCRALAWWREQLSSGRRELSSWWWQRRWRGDHRRDHRPWRRCRDRLAGLLRGTAAAGLLRVAAGLLLRTAAARLLRLLSRLPTGAGAGHDNALPNRGQRQTQGTIR